MLVRAVRGVNIAAPAREHCRFGAAHHSIVALGAKESNLVDVWERTIPMGYPVPTLGRDRILRQIDELLRRNGRYSRGRLGGWRYESCNQDYSFVQGTQAVDKALTGAVEDAFRRPEMF